MDGDNILLHELLHVYGYDDIVIRRSWPVYSKNGIAYGTHDITKWFMKDCHPIEPGEP